MLQVLLVYVFIWYLWLAWFNSTHWSRVTHICFSTLGHHWFRQGLLPVRHQAIIWTNAEMLIGPLGANFTEILLVTHTFSIKKIHLKMSSGKWRPFCLDLNVLINRQQNHCHVLCHIFVCRIFISTKSWVLYGLMFILRLAGISNGNYTDTII